MQNVILRTSSKMIVDVHCFQKDSSTLFKVEFVDYRKTGKTYTDKSGNVRDELEKTIKFIFVDRENLGSQFEKLDNDKICQELKGKSVLITTSIGDR